MAKRKRRTRRSYAGSESGWSSFWKYGFYGTVVSTIGWVAIAALNKNKTPTY